MPCCRSASARAELPQPFRDNLQRWRADISVAPLDVLIVAHAVRLRLRMVAQAPSAGDNVEAFLHLARTRGANRTLLEFLHELESIESAINAESDLSDADQGNCVQVMTAHAAKGLEFPVTIVAGHGEGHPAELGGRELHARVRSRHQVERPVGRRGPQGQLGASRTPSASSSVKRKNRTACSTSP
jgi:ATP-dependent exoDNAse (exonuclease V) beta subunit